MKIAPSSMTFNVNIPEGGTEPVLTVNMAGVNMETLEDTYDIELVLSLDATRAMFDVWLQSMMRMHTVDEMLSIWPEQRLGIMENLLFRWSNGEIADGQEGQQGQ